MKYSRGAAGNDLIFFIFFIIVLGIIWGLTGGPGRSISLEGPFINPPSPLGDGSAYTVPGVTIPSSNRSSGGVSPSNDDRGSISDIISRFRSGLGSVSEETSPYAGMVSLSRGRATDGDPDREYVILKTNRNIEDRLTISDWRVESTVTLLGTTLGGAAYLPFSGRVNTESPVAIGSDTTVYLVTGRSPIGTSFRTNTCIGYFEQFQDFEPKLRKSCPRPEDELRDKIGTGFLPNDTCIDFVEDISRCELTATSIPPAVGSACQNFILEDLTYNGCVSTHKGEAAFYENEWYVYLDRDQELWKRSNDRIRLLDENGLIIDTVSY